jgi:uncharacterized membrane protein
MNNFGSVFKRVSESELEVMLERRMDKLDEQYLAGKITAEQYDAGVREIEALSKVAA